MTYAQEENLWPDSGFEELGVAVANPHGGTKAGRFSIARKNVRDTYEQRQLDVEPFAVYEATAFVRRDPASSGYVQALYAHGWDSFEWSFISWVDVPVTDQWTPVATRISVPDNSVTFNALVIGKASGDEAVTAYIDDLRIVKILSGEEHLRQLRQKAAADLTVSECEMLSRYWLKENRLDEMDKLRLATPHDQARADIACLLAQKATADPAVQSLLVADMVCHGALDLAYGEKRLQEFFEGLSFHDGAMVCIAAIRQGGDAEYVQQAVQQYQRYLGSPDTFASAVEIQEAIQALDAAKGTLTEPQAAVGEELLNTLTENAKALHDTLLAQKGSRVVTISGIPLAADGTAIVLPQEPTPSERHAAKELRRYLHAVTGLELPIVNETAPLPPHVMLIGRSANAADYGFDVDYAKLGLEGIHIESANGNLMLGGNKRGVVYAVYRFLEEYLGCQWFMADCERIPNSGRADLGDFRKVYVPPLEYRDTDYTVCRPTAFGVRNQLNGPYSQADEAWGGNISYGGGFVHTFELLIPPEKYGMDHPEYFSEINGKRLVNGSQLCLTNPDVKRIATETVLQWIRSNPEATIFSVSQNDCENYCTCPECSALAEKEGSQAGPLLHFVNHIADAVREQYPDKIIDTLAYTYTRKPPKFVKPAPNVCVRLCSIECCFSHPLDECPSNKSFVEDVVGWSKICRRLHIWDYVINYAHCIQPFPNLRVLKSNINFFINHGVTGIYEEANFFGEGGELAELRSYLLAKLLWDPSTDDKKAIVDFTEAYYGPAGVHIRDYLDVIHTVCDKDLHVGIYDPPEHYLADTAMRQKADACLARAKDAVKDDPTLLQQVELASLPMLYTNLQLGTSQLHRSGNTLKINGVSNGKNLEDFIRIAKRAGVTHVAEGTRLNAWLAQKQAIGYKEALDIITLESPFMTVELLPTLGGRVWRAVHKASGHEILRVVGDNDKGYTPDNGGYEEYNTDEYRGGGFGEVFQVVEATSDFAVLRCQFKDGSVATRTVFLLSDQPGFTVTTQYNGVSSMEARCCRNHPEFNVPKSSAILFVKRADGTSRVDLSRQSEIWMQEDALPVGEWGVQFPLNGKTATLTCRFDPANVKTCYVYVAPEKDFITMEEWTKELPLTPASGPRLSNTYLFTVE